MMKTSRYTAPLAGIACLACAAAELAHASPILPDAIAVTVPGNSNDPTSPYTDDVYVDSLTFGGTIFSAVDQIAAIARFQVLSGRGQINSEWGDNDTAADGDDNPFAKAGFDPALQETTDPTIQDETLLQTFNTFSLSEMSDGEGGGSFHIRAAFSQSLTDNALGTDNLPELVFFERGLNDDFAIRLITGGTFDAPVLTDWLETSSRGFYDTAITVDTLEISRAQKVGVGGYDLSEFGLNGDERAYGFELISRNGTGPDLNGFFLTAEDPGDFGTPLPGVPIDSAVPLPAAVYFMLAGFGALAGIRRFG